MSAFSSTGTSTTATTKHPTFHGIHSRYGMWVAEICHPSETCRVWLGTFQTAQIAAAAYDVAALVLKVANATLNFPEFVGSYRLPKSPDLAMIRSAAGEAVELMKLNKERVDRHHASGAMIRSAAREPVELTKLNKKRKHASGGDELAMIRSAAGEAVELMKLNKAMEDRQHASGGNEVAMIRSAAGEAVQLMKLNKEREDIQHASCVDELAGQDVEFVDEEAIYNMPSLLLYMAEGLLMSPPRQPAIYDQPPEYSYDWDNLWNY